MMIVWRMRGKLSKLFCAVLCMTDVLDDTHAHEHFLKMSVGLGSDFVRLFRFSLLYALLCA